MHFSGLTPGQRGEPQGEPIPKLLAAEELFLIGHFGLPLEKGEGVIKNERIETSVKGEVGQIYTYASEQSIKAIFDAHKSFFAKNGWEVLSSIDEAKFKSLYADNKTERASIKVDISTNTVSGITTVDLVVVDR